MFASLPALAVLVESLAVAGYGVYLAVATALTPAVEPVAAVVMSALCLALGAGLFLLARAVGARRRWSRSPVLVWQVLQASVAIPALGSRWPLGVALLALCAVVVVGVGRSLVDGDGEPRWS